MYRSEPVSLHLWLLGPWRATLDGESLPELPTRYTRALLARLALGHPHFIPRAELQYDLWPDASPAQGAGRLRTALHLLRRALPGLLHTDKEAVALDASLIIQHDVGAFRRALEPLATQTMLQEGVSLYRGTFLKDPPDGWAARQAQDLYMLYVETVRRLLVLAQMTGDSQTALWAGRLWVREEPWEEEAHVAVVQSLYRLGDRVAAEAQIAYARSLLEGEWKQPPTEAFAALSRAVARLPLNRSPLASLPGMRLAAFTAEPVSIDFDQLPLVGRQNELEQLDALWKEACQGRAQVVVVEAPPGTGKSRLAEEFLARVALRQPTLILRGRAHEHATSCALAWLDDVFQQLTAGLRRRILSACCQLDATSQSILQPYLRALNPRLAQPEAPEMPPGAIQVEQARRRMAWFSFLQLLTKEGPICLLLEDAHLADGESLALVRGLMGQELPVLIILTRNPVPIPAKGDRLPVMRLAPLDKETMQTMLQYACRGHLTPWLLERLVARSGGNPLFAHEIIRTLQAQKQLQWQAATGWELVEPDIALPDPLTNSLAQRLQTLSRVSADFVTLLAVLGRAADEGLLARLWPDQAIRNEARAEAIGQWVLVEQADKVWFFHDWLAEQVLSSLDPAVRRQWHAYIATVLGDDPRSNAAERMVHAARGGLWEDALTQALQAGEEAVIHGYLPVLCTAVSIAAEAVQQLALRRDDSRIWRLLLLEESLLAQSEHGKDWQRTLRLLQEMAEHSGSPRYQIEALLRQGRAQGRQGYHQSARHHLRRAIRLARQIQQPAEEAAARSTLALALNDAGEWAAAQREGRAALRASINSGDSAIYASVAITTAFIDHYRGGREAESTHLGPLLNQPEIQAKPPLAARAYRDLGLIYVAQGRYGEAIALLQKGVQLAQQIGDVHELFTYQGMLGSILIACGVIAEGKAVAEACLPLALRLGSSKQLAMLLLHVARAAFYEGNASRALQLLQESIEIAEELALPEHLAAALALQARFLLELGQLAPARAAAMRGAALISQQPDLALNPSHILAQVWLAGGERARAKQAAEYAVARTTASGIYAWITPEALWEAALVLASVNEHHRARQVQEQAYALFLDHLAAFDEAARRQAILDARPTHRALGNFSSKGSRRLVHLPLRDVPTGRRLYPDELMPVIWTLHASGDAPLATAAGRQQRLQRLVAEATAQGAEATVSTMADMLGVVSRTVLRDLAALRRQGIVVETRGSRG